jgi:alpha-ribazole phosphatase/probable phosphoglycerate mutase
MAISTTLDFLRHGEPVGGKRYRGRTDDPLSERGWAQMVTATAGARPWMAIVTSPLIRCRAFAEWLARVADVPLRVDDRLAEVGFGEWEGRTAEELDKAQPNCVFDFKCDPLGRRPEGAEPLQAFSARVIAAYEQIVVRHKGEHVLVVAHAGVIRMAVSHALGLPPERVYRINVGSASMARIRIEHRGGKRLDSLMWVSKGGG